MYHYIQFELKVVRGIMGDYDRVLVVRVWKVSQAGRNLVPNWAVSLVRVCKVSRVVLNLVPYRAM